MILLYSKQHKQFLEEFSYLKPFVATLTEPPFTPERLDMIEKFLAVELPDLEKHDAKIEVYYVLGFMNHDLILRCLQILYDHDRLNMTFYRKICMWNNDWGIMGRHVNIPSNKIHEHLSQDCKNHVLSLYNQLVWEAGQDLSPENAYFLRSIWQYQGSKYFVFALKHVLKSQIKKLKASSAYSYEVSQLPMKVVAHMAETFANDMTTPEKREALIAELRDVVNTHPVIDKTAPFKVLFPVAKHFRDVLCDLLGWEDMMPLMRYIGGDGANSQESTDDLEHIHIAEVYQLLANIPKERVIEVLSLIVGASADGHKRAFLILALLGVNRAEVQKKFRQHGQSAIKAYGLLPLMGDETLLSRYLALKQSAKDGQKFGAQRRLSHARAVEIGIDHLGQMAGYGDGSRLEWAMEAQLATETPRQWVVDEYTILLEQDGIEMGLVIIKEGRTLKSVPKNIRGTLAYTQAMDTLKQLRAQLSRFRLGLLEGLISSGEMLLADDMTTLLRLPIARALFPKLIWRNMSGEMGLLDVDQMVLIGTEGQKYHISNAIGLAHSYDLFQAGKLADWQRYIVHHRIVQPIKQAFRELYILTPAEKETAIYSNRFAGHAINGLITSRLLSGRGWRMPRGEGETYMGKLFGDIRAVWQITGVWHYIGFDSPTVSAQIHFEPYDTHKKRTWRNEEFRDDWLSLDAISPLIFSEVMRDADLVVSVAQREGEGVLSKEVYEARAQLITILLDDLGLPNVQTEGHFAYVKGKLANYRVHLGSAVIHIEPGNYLCIVPAKWGMTHENLFLPFADEKDGKISEVISKILLLLADDKIKDESILQQIRQKS